MFRPDKAAFNLSDNIQEAYNKLVNFPMVAT